MFDEIYISLSIDHKFGYIYVLSTRMYHVQRTCTCSLIALAVAKKLYSKFIFFGVGEYEKKKLRSLEIVHLKYSYHPKR